MTTSFIRLFFVHKINEKTTEGELDMLKIQDFCDMNKFESIMDAWAKKMCIRDSYDTKELLQNLFQGDKAALQQFIEENF